MQPLENYNDTQHGGKEEDTGIELIDVADPESRLYVKNGFLQYGPARHLPDGTSGLLAFLSRNAITGGWTGIFGPRCREFGYGRVWLLV